MAEYRLNQQGQQVQTAIDKALALGPATSSSAGTMSAADKSKLDSMNPSNYQPLLVGSGTGQNIKTVNNQSILGPGNIDAGGSVTVDSALSSTSTNPVQNRVINAALAGKQATLVGSGTGQNIKTINNQNILGSGNIDAGSLVTIDSSLSSTSENPVQNKVINTALGGKQDTISDLATIRSGAAAGATAVQPSALSAKQDVLVPGTNIKTINSQSILGPGNMDIEGGGVGFNSITTPSTPDGTMIITLTNGDTITMDLNHNHPQYPKYVYCSSQSAYDAITTKESDTLYLILETN